MHSYSNTLSTETTSEQQHPMSASTPRTQIFVSQHYFLPKEGGIHRKITDSRTEAGRVKKSGIPFCARKQRRSRKMK